MKKIYVLWVLTIFCLISGCEKKSKSNGILLQDKNDDNVKETIQNSSEDKDENKIKTSQETEYSAKDADAILESLEIKSYDIWSYLRPETGEETEEFLNQEFNNFLLSSDSEYKEEIKNKKEQRIEEYRKLIHGRYKVEQENPLIIKVNCKDENNKYMTEARFGESAYTYFSPNGFLMKADDKWYEICGYGNYQKNLVTPRFNSWMYSVEHLVEIEYHTYGFGKSDEKTYTEEKVKEMFIPNIYAEEKFEERTYAYMCDDLTVNVYYRLYDEIESLDRGKVRDVHICFYTMLDEYKAVTCHLWVALDNTGNYNDITEEKLREIFTIREYE